MAQHDLLEILFLESFYGGSHRYVADGLIANSKHRFALHTLKAQAWKWRIRASAIHFMEQVQHPEQYDLLLVSDLINVSDLRAWWGPRCPPTIVYYHENQLCYPHHPSLERDPQFDIPTVTSALAADRMVFNTEFHRNAFLSALGPVLTRIPKPRPRWILDEVERKSSVLHPGCTLPEHPPDRSRRKAGPARIVWNHRWEYDKQPDVFFRVLERIDAFGIPFELIVLGGRYKDDPETFVAAKDRFGSHIRHWGWADSTDEYHRLLGDGDIVVSTAIQENFGISAVEAMHMGCYPLFPRRLSYPEIVPSEYHSYCLYGDEDQLFTRLKRLCRHISNGNPFWRKPVDGLAEGMERFTWPKLIQDYDDLFSETAGSTATTRIETTDGGGAGEEITP